MIPFFGGNRKSSIGRKAIRVNADFYLNKIISDQPHLARARDISTEGIYLYKILEPQLSHPQKTVGLEFQLPGSEETIWAVGEIVRDEPAVSLYRNRRVNGVAIKFLRIDARDRKRIHAFVAARSADESKKFPPN